MKKDVNKCSMCGKNLEFFDKQENFHFKHYFGFGSKHDLEKIDVILCCECMDSVLDKILPMFKENPLVEYDL